MLLGAERFVEDHHAGVEQDDLGEGEELVLPVGHLPIPVGGGIEPVG